MKTNFLSKQTIIGLLFSTIFLMVNTSQAFSQVEWNVSINSDANCSDGNLTYSGLTNSNTTEFNSSLSDTNSSSCEDEAVLTRYDRKDFHVHIGELTDPNNTLTATEALVKDIKTTPSDYQTSWGNHNSFSNVAFRFGVHTGDFVKSYSVRYYLERIKAYDGNWYQIYRKRLYYDKGYIDLLSSVNIDLYGGFDDVGNGIYILMLNGTPLECGDIAGADRVEIASFMSTYGRPNDGNAQFLHRLSNVTSMPPGCPADPCKNYTIAQYGENHATPICNVTRKTACQNNGLIPLPWGSLGTFGGGNREVPSNGSEIIGIDVYPNPTDNLINITLKTPDAESVELKIINSTGELVYQKTVQADNLIRVDVATLPAGIYYVKVDSKYEFETQKFTILK